jgi:N-acetylmuramoyl-L-alanine amidase
MSLIFSLLFCTALFSSEYAPRPATIMLDPAGDARTTGRTIDDNFERGVTLEFSQALKGALESLVPGARIVLTRVPGEAIAPLQNANFANRLNVTLFVSLHCYQDTETRPCVATYYHLQHPITDMWHKPQSLTFYPYDNAHVTSVHTSVAAAQAAYKQLCSYKSISCKPSCGIPFKPLVGVTCPAIAFEIGIKHKDSWQNLVSPLAQTIAHCLGAL